MVQSAFVGRTRYRTAGLTFLIGLALGLMARELAVSAYAQLMDPGQQRLETNQGITQLNAKMSEMLTLLHTGTLKVRVVGSDKTSESARSVSFEPTDPAPPPKPVTENPSSDAADGSR